MRKILIIHQHQEERERLAFALESAAFLLTAEDIEGRLKKLCETSLDIVIMADSSPRGQELSCRMREFSGIPLVVLRRGNKPARLIVLEMGADVYLNEPVSPKQLVARVYSLLRH